MRVYHELDDQAELSFQEIGQRMGITKSAASQYYRNALRKLRGRSQLKRLHRQFLQERCKRKTRLKVKEMSDEKYLDSVDDSSSFSVIGRVSFES